MYTHAARTCVGVYQNMHHANNDEMSPGKDMVSADARHRTHSLHTPITHTHHVNDNMV